MDGPQFTMAQLAMFDFMMVAKPCASRGKHIAVPGPVMQHVTICSQPQLLVSPVTVQEERLILYRGLCCSAVMLDRLGVHFQLTIVNLGWVYWNVTPPQATIIVTAIIVITNP
jgi:hypothetical protein